MNYKLFEKVIENINGNIIGVNINSKPEYQEDFKELLKDFNNFTKLICPDNLETINISNRWQNSGNYKKYFWNQYKIIDNNIVDKGYSIWIGISYDGIKIQCGTTQNYDLDRQKENENIFKYIDRSVEEIFSYQGIFDYKIISKFEKNEYLDVSYDRYAALFFQYTGNSAAEDIEYFKIILSFLGNQLKNYLKNKKIDNTSKNQIMSFKNIILYGAPGVGKTHNYKKLISLIDQGKSQSEIFDSIQSNEKFVDEDESFQKIKNEKRIEFITFHQSFSYEDFIEGFRPQESGNIEIEDGIFKLISKNADNQSFQLDTKTINFDEAYDILRAKYFENELEKIFSVSNIQLIIHEFKENTIKIQSSNAKDAQYVKKSDLETVVKAFMKNEIDKPSDIKRLDVKKDTISLAGLYYPIGNLISKIMKENKVVEEVEKNYYLVIDEINRGNISKIFGELITLIEESKRSSYEVTLPYSKQKFSVPSNLYIIGTMNTTDKSIALIDVALRRRFTFIKMEPNSDLVLPIFKNTFNKLNDCIRKHIGEDYQIGHSYFMNIDESDLEFVKKYKIKPLLEEYYYGDDRIIEVLDILGL
ncbi:McrB family protein [Aliarcobacter cibarius]|uniref:McrB family protein n=1 Tax=Aliarcobacter cibarius TaxID=255507 RepID=UPI0010FE039B|nr:AAA family ATPase [Aliarcobacter cibarius]TLT03485.1 hypothetical protein FE248_07040 [Aliarcobacter cibarius]